MTASLLTPTLRLSLPANNPLPHNLNWKIEEGYVRTFAWDTEGETITLGIWGPGEWVTTAFSSSQAIELQCLTPVVASQFHPTAADIDQLLRRQLQNIEEIFQLNRIRSADQRLLALLTWIGSRFGQVSASGYRLSFKELNFTHQSLAELCGLTRVTVTKALSRYREIGTLQKLSPEDWFIPRSALYQASPEEGSRMNSSSIDQAYPNGTPVLLTLKFKNGEVLRRQSALILLQYLSDPRLSSFEPEIQDCDLQRTTRPNS